MDREVMKNRCLVDATQWRYNACRTVGDNACGDREPERFRYALSGLQFLPAQLRPMDLYKPSTLDFSGAASRWEKLYSSVLPDRNSTLTMAPVVDGKAFVTAMSPIGPLSWYPVIGYYGKVTHSDIIVPREYYTMRTDESAQQLARVMDAGVDAYVERGYPGGSWVPLSPANSVYPIQFTVFTNIEGKIQAVLDTSGTEPGLESEDPLSYVAVGVALFKLATMGGRAILGVLARRAAAKTAAEAEQRVLTRLAETAQNLRNQVVTRSSEVLRSPKIFRHSITGSIKPAIYANIERDGGLLLSKPGMNAQYGIGAYAWLQGATETATYVDVEVAAGTGVETLTANGQTFVRMIPPEGNLVRIRIVGTNLTKEQIEMGRRLAGRH